MITQKSNDDIAAPTSPGNYAKKSSNSNRVNKILNGLCNNMFV